MKQYTSQLGLFILVWLLAAGCGGDSGGSSSADMGTGLVACADGEDNDGDGLIDGDDPGCTRDDDDDETNAIIVPECSDMQDNDGDGNVDLDDRGCANADDTDESDDPDAPQCDDGEDNDGDGAIDTDDPGCADRGDTNEADDPEVPECSDGLDNDEDGFTDFPADPGCGSEFDRSEAEGAGQNRPQCANGLDDDNDGLVDIADPGCSSVADPREQNMEGENPACANGLDDDADGIVDFPLEPGCSAAGDEDEADPMNAPGCGNGRDDDMDGLSDYPQDPGCSGVGDRDETDPPVAPRCSDGVDNDRDGEIDFPDDRGCQSAADGSEGGSCGRNITAVETESGEVIRGDSRRAPFGTEGSCGGRGSPEVVLVHRVARPIEALIIRTDLEENELETTLYVRRGCLDPSTEIACNRETVNDGIAANSIRIPTPPIGEYYIFVDGSSGRGGNFAVVVDEVPRAECLNGEDDDGDGLTDYPNDPGCYRADDRDETDPETPPACADNQDNDGDGVVDYPLDFGCQSAGDDDEVDVCGQGVRLVNYPVGAPSLLTDTSDGGSNHVGSCVGGAAPEKIVLYENPFNARLVISVNHPETIERTAVYMRTACGNAGSELACDAGDQASGQRGTITIDRAPPGPYFIFLDHGFGLGGQVRVSVQSERLPPGCSDEVDNDEDGFIDADDVGCENGDDEDERDPPQGEDPPVCFDGVDNDQDGLTDFPFDPGCVAKGDFEEDDPAVAVECSNGQDDDEDGVPDFPNDIGCYAASDDDEQAGRRAPQCTNRIDDDQDGLTDYPNDPGCSAGGDGSEEDDPYPPACGDGEDNDRDGLVDFPFEPGCEAAGDPDETDPEMPAACSNGLDDDEDNVTDFPFEPGCSSAGDNDETDPNFPPNCANGRDDDNNGRVDWPDDPGCAFAGDAVERSDGNLPARCADGVDNDQDGSVDLTDVGCMNADDNDEADEAVVPACSDGADNDMDGVIDWPDDEGCAARGDVCEQGGFGVCNGQCLDLQNSSQNCGSCGTVCPADIDCIEGLCGGLSCRVLQDVHVLGPNGGQVNLDTRNQPTSGSSCGGGGPQSVIVITIPGRRTVTFEATAANYDTYFHLRSECDDPNSTIICNDDGGVGTRSRISRALDAGTYYLIVDGFARRAGTSTVTVTVAAN